MSCQPNEEVRMNSPCVTTTESSSCSTSKSICPPNSEQPRCPPSKYKSCTYSLPKPTCIPVKSRCGCPGTTKKFIWPNIQNLMTTPNCRHHTGISYVQTSPEDDDLSRHISTNTIHGITSINDLRSWSLSPECRRRYFLDQMAKGKERKDDNVRPSQHLEELTEVNNLHEIIQPPPSTTLEARSSNLQDASNLPIPEIEPQATSELEPAEDVSARASVVPADDVLRASTSISSSHQIATPIPSAGIVATRKASIVISSISNTELPRPKRSTSISNTSQPPSKASISITPQPTPKPSTSSISQPPPKASTSSISQPPPKASVSSTPRQSQQAIGGNSRLNLDSRSCDAVLSASKRSIAPSLVQSRLSTYPAPQVMAKASQTFDDVRMSRIPSYLDGGYAPLSRGVSSKASIESNADDSQWKTRTSNFSIGGERESLAFKSQETLLGSSPVSTMKKSKESIVGGELGTTASSTAQDLHEMDECLMENEKLKAENELLRKQVECLSMQQPTGQYEMPYYPPTKTDSRGFSPAHSLTDSCHNGSCLPATQSQEALLDELKMLQNQKEALECRLNSGGGSDEVRIALETEQRKSAEVACQLELLHCQREEKELELVRLAEISAIREDQLKKLQQEMIRVRGSLEDEVMTVKRELQEETIKYRSVQDSYNTAKLRLQQHLEEDELLRAHNCQLTQELNCIREMNMAHMKESQQSARQAVLLNATRLEPVGLSNENGTQPSGRPISESCAHFNKQNSENFELYLRAKSYRKALTWQKKYLCLVIQGYKTLLDSTGAGFGHYDILRNQIPLAPSSIGLINRMSAITRFRICAKAVLATVRMKFMVRRWDGRSRRLMILGQDEGKGASSTRSASPLSVAHLGGSRRRLVPGLSLSSLSGMAAQDVETVLSDYLRRVQVLESEFGEVFMARSPRR